MYTLCWSVIGGCGTTVTASALALLAARNAPTILIDLAGDVPATLGLVDSDGPGVTDWCAAPYDDLLERFAVPVVDGLQVIRTGTGDRPTAAMWERLSRTCSDMARSHTIVIDAGSSAPPAIAHERAAQSLLVVRACYLTLRRAVRCTGLATGAVVVSEPARALSTDDVERAVGVPVLADIAWDPSIARAVDAGLLSTRLPAAFSRQLSQVVPHGVTGAPARI